MKSLSYKAPRRADGWTLIEVMIVMAIVGILATIAYNSYSQQIRRSRRAAAEAFMMEVGQRQQQRFLDVRAYAPDMDALAITIPTDVSDHYELTIEADAGPPPGYTLTAAPTGAQSHDHCGDLGLSNNGVKTPEECW